MATEIITLDGLAERINKAHRKCLARAADTVREAIEVGRLLCEAKAALAVEDANGKASSYGKWIPWIEQNLEFGPRQAQKYLQVYECREEIEERQKRIPNSHFVGLQGAIEILAAPDWTESEEHRRTVVEAGYSVVANMKADASLIRWAKAKDLFMAVDRTTDWGNPFLIDADGDRDTVIDSYTTYLVLKPSLQARFDELRGKVLGCWCYPEACHGDVLIRNAYGETAPDEARRVGCHK